MACGRLRTAVVVYGWPNWCTYVAVIRSATALQVFDRVVVMPVVVQRQVPIVRIVQKSVVFPQLQFVVKLLTCLLLCNDRCPLFRPC